MNEKEITVKIPKNPAFGISAGQARRFIEQEHLNDYNKITLDFSERGNIGESFVRHLLKVYSGERPDVEISIVGANEKIIEIIMEMGKEVKIYKEGWWCDI